MSSIARSRARRDATHGSLARPSSSSSLPPPGPRSCRVIQARPLYVLLVLASLALNLPEAFPMSVILGLLLARSLGPAAPTGRQACPLSARRCSVTAEVAG